MDLFFSYFYPDEKLKCYIRFKNGRVFDSCLIIPCPKWPFMTIRFTLVSFLLLFAVFATAQVIPDEIRVDYTAVKKELQSVLWDLSKKSKVNIAFSPEKIPSDSLINISVKNQTLGLTLKEIFKGSELTYEIVGNQIVIRKDEFIYSEEDITINGYIRDVQSGEELVYANVFFKEIGIGTETNVSGFYSLTVPNGVQRIYVTYLGYKNQILELKLKKDTTINIELEPEALLNEVLIVEENFTQIDKSTSSSNNLPVDQIRSIATLGGEPDVIRLAQMMPGVSSGADGFGGLNVRGGSSDQNLILFDGVPVYNTGHGLGIFSVFNSNMIKSADLIKGGIPARYGGRLSSVLDIRTKDGNMRETAGELSVGALAFKGTLEGPIAKDKSSYLISVRRTILDPWIKNVTEYFNELNEKEGFANYYFYDLNAKLNFKFGDTHKLGVSYYRGKDFYNNEVTTFTSLNGESTEELNQDNWDWGNQIAVAKLSSRLGQKAFSNISVYQSQFEFASFDHQRFEEQDTFFQAGLYKSKITDLGVKWDLDLMPNPSNYVKIGASFVNHTFNPGLISENEGNPNISLSSVLQKDELDELLIEDDLSNQEITVYGEDEIKIGESLKLNLGLNLNYITANTKSYFNWQPRVSFIAEGDDFWWKGGVSKMNQYLHLLTSTGLGLPTDLWIPSTDNIAPEKAWLFSSGIGVDFGKGRIFGLEAFYKLFDDVVAFNEGGLLPVESGTDWDAIVPVGKGNAYGVEVSLDKTLGSNLWYINYTLSVSNRTFSDLNGGRQFPFHYDRRHQLKFIFIRKLNENAEFSLNWTYGTGNPVTLPFELIEFTDENNVRRLLPVYRDKNNSLLPDYHRLDIGFNFYSDYSFGKQKFTIGLYNAYNRRNPLYMQLKRNIDRPERFEFGQYSLLPILPSISYSLSF